MADRSGGISRADGGTFEVGYKGPFSLAASIRFLEGFTPSAHESSSPSHLDLAFCAGPLWHPVAVRVAERAGKVIGSFVGDVSPEAVARTILVLRHSCPCLSLPRSDGMAPEAKPLPVESVHPGKRARTTEEATALLGVIFIFAAGPPIGGPRAHFKTHHSGGHCRPFGCVDKTPDGTWDRAPARALLSHRVSR